MRKAILIAIGLTLAATAASAQTSRRDDRDDGWRSDRRDWREDRGGDRYEDDKRGRSMTMGSQGGRGARFMVRSGDSRIRVACDPGETMRNCVDAALILFDKVRQTAPSASSSSGSSSAPTTSTVPTPSR